VSFTEATVEAATLDWLAELGYGQRYGPDIEPGELHAERAGFGQAVLLERLRTAVACINPALPVAALDEAVRKVARTEASLSDRDCVCSTTPCRWRASALRPPPTADESVPKLPWHSFKGTDR